MTTLIQSEYALGAQIAPTPSAANVCAYRASVTLAADQVAADTIIEMGCLPTGCQLLDAIVDTDQLDSGDSPTITFNVGVMSGTFGDDDTSRTCDDSIIDGATTAQAGGVVRPTLTSAFRETFEDPYGNDISTPVEPVGIGIEIETGPATAKGGTIGLTLYYTG